MGWKPALSVAGITHTAVGESLALRCLVPMEATPLINNMGTGLVVG